MGLAGELSYKYPPPTIVHHALQAFAASRAGAWIFSRTLARADRFLSRFSHGRVTVPEIVARLPVLVLTSTGRKTGEPRQTHLTAVPFRDTLALVGTNFGQARTPSWVLNLETDPRAAVTYRGITREVVARPATEAERSEVLSNSVSVYVGYVKYQQRITGRRLRIFILELAATDPT